MSRALFAILICGALLAQTTYTISNRPWKFYSGTVPATETVVVTGTVYVDEITLSNTTAAAVTVTVKDRGTDCQSAACNIVPTISVAANTLFVIGMQSRIAPSGITWQASSGTAIDGCIRYRTTLSAPQ